MTTHDRLRHQQKRSARVAQMADIRSEWWPASNRCGGRLRVGISGRLRRNPQLFGQAGCVQCHSGPFFTDASFHRIEDPRPASYDAGLAEVTGNASDIGAFRTPSLINAALTAPYLHDGSAKTLTDAIRRHQTATLGSKNLAALVSFIQSLTDHKFVSDHRLSLPQRACGRRL